MAENLKALRRRIRSISNTRKVTRAMEMVSAAKLRRAQMQLNAGRPYASKLQELLALLAASAEQSDPLFEEREVSHTTLLIFAGDRGLCGSFNSNVIGRAQKYIEAEGIDRCGVYCVGRKVRDAFRKQPVEIVGEQVRLSGRVDSEAAREIARDLRELFLSGKTDRVLLIYNHFVSQVKFDLMLEQFLPLDPEAMQQADQKKETAMREGGMDFIFEPDRASLYARLLPRYLESKIYISMANSMTAEHSARRMSMNNATKNCGELIDSLTLKMNKARQAAITKEISEVVGGAEALKG